LLGFTALLTQNGAEALDAYREHEDDIACVILDLSMPGMTGDEVAKSIWQISPTTKIILCSGHDKQRAMQGVSDSIFVSFLKKPLSLADLRTALQQILVG
jgi:CheY-like chemotaxis protein